MRKTSAPTKVRRGAGVEARQGRAGSLSPMRSNDSPFDNRTHLLGGQDVQERCHGKRASLTEKPLPQAPKEVFRLWMAGFRTSVRWRVDPRASVWRGLAVRGRLPSGPCGSRPVYAELRIAGSTPVVVAAVSDLLRGGEAGREPAQWQRRQLTHEQEVAGGQRLITSPRIVLPELPNCRLRVLAPPDVAFSSMTGAKGAAATKAPDSGPRCAEQPECRRALSPQKAPDPEAGGQEVPGGGRRLRRSARARS